MKWVALSFIFVSYTVLADCLCEGISNSKLFIQKKARSQDSCKAGIIEELLAEHKQGIFCLSEESIEIKWRCDGSLSQKKISCDLLRDIVTGEESLILAQSIEGLLTSDYSPQITCDDRKMEGMSLNFKDKKEFEQSMNDLGLKGSEILDRVNDGTFTLVSTNDNLITDMGHGGKSNDRGNTHALLMKFDKALNDEYFVTISYESNLFTQFTNPEKPNYKKNAQKITHVSQFFIEENLAKLTLSKAKNGDALFGDVGGGVHQLNKDKINNSVIFSALTQQRGFHNLFIDHQQRTNPGQKVVTKVYNNVPQRGSKTGVMLEGALGKRHTVDGLSGDRMRTFLEGSATGRLTSIDNASYAGGEVSANTDIRFFRETTLRLSGGVRSKVYITSQTTNEKFVNVSVGNRKFETGITVTEPDKKLAGYQNPLPQNMARRDELAPGKNKFYQVYFKVKW